MLRPNWLFRLKEKSQFRLRCRKRRLQTSELLETRTLLTGGLANSGDALTASVSVADLNGDGRMAELVVHENLATVDSTELAKQFQDIEEIDLRDSIHSSLILSRPGVVALTNASDRLVVRRNEGDRVFLGLSLIHI